MRRPARPRPTEQSGDPPVTRIAARTVMRAEWADPEDTRPGAARAARKVHGWRSYCPLRRMAGNPASGITPAHVMAADKLRELWDLAILGRSAGMAMVYITRSPGPSQGFGPADLARVAAFRALRRALAPFDPTALDMIYAILLRNLSLHAWAIVAASNVRAERIRLRAVLEHLARHFDTDIAAELDRGQRLPP